jgi:hypothetical protein
MSTPAQNLANQANAQKSTGPSSQTGKQVSSQNRRIHGLSDPDNVFFILNFEDESKFETLKATLNHDHSPQDETERILVRRMAEAEWLRLRASFLQNMCFNPENGFLRDEKQFALFLRYQGVQERAFYKALNELQKLRKEKRNEQIGFVSQQRAAEAHEMRKQTFEMKKITFETRKTKTPVAKETEQPVSKADSSPQNLEMAA